MAKVLVFTDVRMDGHANGFEKERYPDVPARRTVTAARMQAEFIDKEKGRPVFIPPAMDNVDAAAALASLAHMQPYINVILRQLPTEPHKWIPVLTTMFLEDVFVDEHTSEAARVALTGTVALTRRVLVGDPRKVAGGVAIVRPPGHHAMRNGGMGFCIFNNVAVAAKDAALSGKKVLIVDWDVHHGNGTQDIIAGDPNIALVCLHQLKDKDALYYPGAIGDSRFQGFGVAKHNIQSIGLEDMATSESEYLAKFTEAVDRLVNDHKFRPDLVLVSAGFDSSAAGRVHKDQWGPSLTAATYTAILRHLHLLVGSKIVLVMEGGYDADNQATLLLACAEQLYALGASVESPGSRASSSGGDLPAADAAREGSRASSSGFGPGGFGSTASAKSAESAPVGFFPGAGFGRGFFPGAAGAGSAGFVHGFGPTASSAGAAGAGSAGFGPTASSAGAGAAGAGFVHGFGPTASSAGAAGAGSAGFGPTGFFKEPHGFTTKKRENLKRAAEIAFSQDIKPVAGRKKGNDGDGFPLRLGDFDGKGWSDEDLYGEWFPLTGKLEEVLNFPRRPLHSGNLSTDRSAKIQKK